MDYKFRNNWPAPDDFMLEIGRLTSLWGTLESQMLIAISKFAGYEATLDWRALIMIAHSNTRQKIDIISTLCAELAPNFPQLEEYRDVISKLKAAQSARNSYSHNSVIMNEETGKVEMSRATARGKLRTSVREVKIEEIRDASAKIHVAICALGSLVMGEKIKPVWEREL